MHCAICGKESNAAFLRLGAFSGEEHRQEMLRRHRQLLEELLHEDAGQMPASFTQDDFERFALKLAVHLLHGIGPEMRQVYREVSPFLLDPLQMALELKEYILMQLPATHVFLELAQGLIQLVHTGTYRFLQPVPAPLIRWAVAQAGLLPILGCSRV